MSVYRLSALLPATVLLVCIGMMGCGEDAPEHDVEYGTGDRLDVASLTYGVYQILRSSGIPAEIGPEVKTEYFEGLARGIRVHGSPVLFFEFDSEEEVEDIIRSISKDGRMVGDIPVKESGTPHFYRKGKVIALYFGDREKTLEGLELTLGSQFAGG